MWSLEHRVTRTRITGALADTDCRNPDFQRVGRCAVRCVEGRGQGVIRPTEAGPDRHSHPSLPLWLWAGSLTLRALAPSLPAPCGLHQPGPHMMVMRCRGRSLCGLTSCCHKQLLLWQGHRAQSPVGTSPLLMSQLNSLHFILSVARACGDVRGSQSVNFRVKAWPRRYQVTESCHQRAVADSNHLWNSDLDLERS